MSDEVQQKTEDPDEATAEVSSLPKTDAGDSTDLDDGTYSFDQGLLSRMLGSLADTDTLKEISAKFGLGFQYVFETLLLKNANQTVILRYEDCEAGSDLDFIKVHKNEDISCGVEVIGWSKNIVFNMATPIIISMMETLLGGEIVEGGDVPARPLSAIELDVSKVLFEQAASAVAQLVLGDFKAFSKSLEPRMGIEEPSDDLIPTPMIKLKLAMRYHGLLCPFEVIIPQRAMMKTNAKMLTTNTNAVVKEAAKAPLNAEKWSKQLEKQVSRSDIALKVHIPVKNFKLGELARLQTGDVLPFDLDEGASAQLRANGKNIFSCEFGKSGANYMVKLNEPTPDEQDLLDELLAQ